MWNICLVGFGNVAQGLARILADKRERLAGKYGFEFRITSVVTARRGCLANEQGLDPAMLLEAMERDGGLWGCEGARLIDPLEAIKSAHTDILVETTPTSLVRGEPGLTHIRTALKAKKHVVTSNKGPLVRALSELTALAEGSGVSFRYEGVIMSGTPALNLVRETLAGCDIQHVQGIVNGTTNFILTEMEKGKTYEEALAEAQRLGIAEADPTADVEGWDAAVKACIMAVLFMDATLELEDVERTGITEVTQETIQTALSRGKRIKLVAEVYREKGRVKAMVAPVAVPLVRPLAGIMGAMNAITYTTDHLGDITIVGPGAGRIETGQALLSDLLAIHRIHGAADHPSRSPY
ncbi:MAG: homoserine dehydrogenase [Synergistaceae bacterium]|jgi:homoserine dehydrogenase|nr:homoserine dehydrogenase [Synergistaceae bacterium]